MNTNDNERSQEQYDCEITRPVRILTLADDFESGTDEDLGTDPYNTGCIRIARSLSSR